MFHIYVPIRLQHVLRENNEHIITSKATGFYFSVLDQKKIKL